MRLSPTAHSFTAVSVAELPEVAVFAVPLAVSGILLGTLEPEASRYALFFSMLMFDGLAHWAFDVSPGTDYGYLRDAGFNGVVYFLGTVGWIAVGGGILLRRFRSVAA